MRTAVRVAAIGVLSAYGAGLAPLVRGMRTGPATLQRANGIGYPVHPAPLFSRFALADTPLPGRAPGEQGSADALIETVGQMLDAWGGDTSMLTGTDCALVVGSGGFLYASNAELYWRDGDGSGKAGSEQAPFQVRGPSWGADLIASHWQMRGPTVTLSTGCSSSANALLTATEWIARGKAKRAIVIGAEGLSAVSLAGFDSLLLLDPQGCRPFDRDRAGVQLGEAVAVLMLEAQAPDVGALPASNAVIMGAANLCDTHHLTSASPDGGVMCAVMRQALADAGVATTKIVAIKAHGTGSTDSDAAEANAITTLFGPYPPPVTAFKRYFGHTLGACGALETAALIGCVDNGFIPAAAGFSECDPMLAIAPLRTELAAQAGAYLLNFFGFGGNYTSLVLGFGGAGFASPANATY